MPNSFYKAFILFLSQYEVKIQPCLVPSLHESLEKNGGFKAICGLVNHLFSAGE